MSGDSHRNGSVTNDPQVSADRAAALEEDDVAPAPWCSPIRSRMPTTRNPTRSWSARLAAFSGKIPVWIVQIPAASERRISSSMQRAPDAAAARGLGDVDGALGDARVDAAAGDRRQRGPADDLALVDRDQPQLRQMRRVPGLPGGTSVSNVAFPVAIPSA